MKFYKNGVSITLDDPGDIAHHLSLGYVEVTEQPAPVAEQSPIEVPLTDEQQKAQIADLQPVVEDEKKPKAVKK